MRKCQTIFEQITIKHSKIIQTLGLRKYNEGCACLILTVIIAQSNDLSKEFQPVDPHPYPD